MTPLDPATAVERISGINQELAGVFGRRPANLQGGSSLRGRDELIVCGLLGGKDAGKSTLVNALAGETVSLDRSVVGEGTPHAIAYVHADAETALRSRFEASGEEAVRHTLVQHHADPLRGIVLVDLPDFDSTFREHLYTVRRAVERMDRLVWVLDPKKGDDRAAADLLHCVVRDPENIFCVLNKFDQTLGDDLNGDPDAFWTAKADWFGACLDSLGLQPAETRRFLVSARYPAAEDFTGAVARHWTGQATAALPEADAETVGVVARRAANEMSRLRRELLSPLTAGESRRLKQANASVECAANAEAVLRYFDLDRTVDCVGSVLDAIDRYSASEFDETYVITVARRLARTSRSDTDLARDVLAGRVDRWPILPILYWPLGGVARFLGRRLVAGGTGAATPSIDDMLRAGGRGVSHRVATLHERVRGAFRGLSESLRSQVTVPDANRQAGAATARLADRWEELDDEVLAVCRAESKSPGFLKRAAIWFVLLWFPLLQPLTKGGLEWAAGGKVGHELHGALTIVTAFGAVSLIKGLVASGLVLVLVLSFMYARAIRDVRRVRGESMSDRADPALFVEEVTTAIDDAVRLPLRQPLEDLRSILGTYRDELQGFRPVRARATST